MFFALQKILNLLQVAVVRDIHAALALHRLQQHGARPPFDVCVGYRVEIVVRHVDESRHQRCPVVLVVRLSGGSHHRLRSAVERIERGDDLVCAVQILAPPLAGQL